jgi:hypothetical protein
MAIAFVAVGTRLKADVSVTGSPQSVGLPAGHVSGHLLFLYVLTEDNTGPTTPSGWTLLGVSNPGPSTSSPYAGRPRLTVFYRIDNGSLGATVSVAFNTAAWPTGDPYVLAFTSAHSGADQTGPIEVWAQSSSLATTAAQAHPQLTTAVANDWLLTLRGVGADAAKTFTTSVGGDSERVDDNHGSPAGPSIALYDSNAGLGAGLQTQRTTTASATVEYGSAMFSIAIKPASAANAVTAVAGTAMVGAAAQDASTQAVDGPWDLCTEGGVPEYSIMIDWDNLPTPLNSNWTFEDTGAGWTAFGGATYQRSQTQAYEGLWSGEITTTGAASPRIEADKVAVTEGQRYKASGRIFIDALLPSTASFSVNWYTSGDVYISTSTNVFTPFLNEWLYADGFFVAPATAAKAGVLMDIQGTPGAGIHVYGDLVRLDDDEDPDHFTRANPDEETAGDVISDTVISYGRDQNRQLNPASVGNASIDVINADRKYSPENSSSLLFGNLDPARDTKMEITWGGTVYPLFRGRIDDFEIKADRGDRSAGFTFLDQSSLLQGVTLSTGVYLSLRTGDLINIVLDLAGWTGPRDIDPGATVVAFWWEEGIDAFEAIQRLVRSEGPPAIAYAGPDGTFVFRDRHHRLLRSQSLNSQGTFAAALVDCAAPAATGFSYTPSFEYSHGWRDIVNSVTFEVQERAIEAELTAVWTTEDTISLSTGQSQEVDISTSDPFSGAVTPVSGTDFTVTGAGVVNVTLSRDSGQSVKITLLAVGGAVVITGLQLRAHAIPVRRSVKILKKDTGSITDHGERTYPNDAPWASANDADAISNMILLHYAQRRPVIQLRVTTQDPAHFLQVIGRMISDRIRVINGELGLDADFFVERITHTVQRMNAVNRPPVHAVVLGCEKELLLVSNPFTFDKRGAGFDDGVFDPIQADDADTVFVFDHSTQGQFDLGQFGT